jgi:hypothetical protein
MSELELLLIEIAQDLHELNTEFEENLNKW